MAISSSLGSSALLPAGLGFRNLVINGGMDVWQRGTSFTNPASGSGYTADRMFSVYDGSGATRTISQGQFDPYLSGASITATPPAGTSPTYFLRWNQSVAGTGGSYNILYANRVENVRLLAGKTFTISFYAKAGASLTMPLIDMEQSFGSGGSPSSSVYTTVTSNIAVTTSWQRFTYTFVMPSAAGKVIGTDANSSYTSIRLWVPVNTTFVFDIWGVQLEQNYQPTPFEQRPYGVELQLCQRYYYRTTDPSGSYRSQNGFFLGQSGTSAAGNVQHPVQMRIAPTAVEFKASGNAIWDGTNLYAVTNITFDGNTNIWNARIYAIVSSGLTQFRTYTLIAENDLNTYLGFSAEL
jgi:hypothetical protein